MRARTRILSTLAAASTVAAAATLTAPVIAPPPAPEAVATAATALRTAEAEAELARLDEQADTVGVAAERADEALLDRRGSARAAGTARDALIALARRQEPELAAVAAVLGSAFEAPASTVALMSRSSASRELRALAFARRQIGKPYRYAADGPHAYDCSGLTMRAYRAAGIGIGGHSATRQWRDAWRHHRLVPFRDARRGDLIFYGRPGAVYHVAIDAGGGRMIEAPYPGKPVREVAVRRAGRMAEVARPA